MNHVMTTTSAIPKRTLAADSTTTESSNSSSFSGPDVILSASLSKGIEELVLFSLQMGANVNLYKLDNNNNYTNDIINSKRRTTTNIELSTPLMKVIKNGYKTITKRLIDYNANINLQDYCTGQTALHKAILYNNNTNGHKNNNIEIIQLLIKRRDINCNIQDYNGKTPLMYAIENESADDIVEMLLLKDRTSTTKKKIIDINIQDRKGQTAIMYAIKTNNERIVQTLLIQYHSVINFNLVTTTTITTTTKQHFLYNNHYHEIDNILLLAIDYGNDRIVQHLLEYSSPDLVNYQTQAKKRTALSYACEYGYLSIVQLLLKQNNNKNYNNINNNSNLQEDIEGKTPLTYAVQNEYDDIVQLLIDNINNNNDKVNFNTIQTNKETNEKNVQKLIQYNNQNSLCIYYIETKSIFCVLCCWN